MNRRGFLSFLGAATAIAAVDPEALLWTPGKKLISIPKSTFGLEGFEEFIEIYIQPAAKAIADQIDAQIMQRFTIVSAAESAWRRQAKNDLEFVSGNQWAPRKQALKVGDIVTFSGVFS